MGTHTYAKLEISDSAFKEISEKLRSAGYDHAFMDDGVIDMHGIGVVTEEKYIATRGQLRDKLNAAIDKLAVKRGTTREELLRHVRELLVNRGKKKD